MTVSDSPTFTRRDVIKIGAALPLSASLAGPTWGHRAAQAMPALAQDAAIAELVAGNTAFALHLYAALRGTVAGNLLVSPYSVSQALAMTYAGARGETAEQMAETLYFSEDQNALHTAFGALTADLVARGNAAASRDRRQPARTLNAANGLWGEQTYPFSAAYTAALERYYGTELHEADFISAPEATREEINAWIEDQTEDRIQDMLAPGTIPRFTTFVLANAIYFYGDWEHPFDPADTRDDSFILLGGTTVTVPFMTNWAYVPYARGKGFQVLELPYADSGFALTIILPDAGQFDAIDMALNVNRLDVAVPGLTVNLLDVAVNRTVETNVAFYLPKFTFDTATMKLNDPLQSLGMVDAFDPDRANFIGMVDAVPPPSPVIGQVMHKAFIAVDERGTEAAAATVVIGSPAATGPEPIEVRIDRPFLFLIRDTVTGTILFLGRVLEPST
jgi:serpin B